MGIHKKPLIVVLFFLTIVLSYSTSLTHQLHEIHSTAIIQEGASNGAGSIIGGFIVGPILLFCSFICIWYNQKRAAIDARRLKMARQICEDVDVTSKASAMSKDGQLVYANGQTVTTAVIGDHLSGINGPNLIKIKRVVQVLEWRSHTVKRNGRNQTEYRLDWVSSNLQNVGGRFNNPANWFITNDTIYNSQVYLGGYNISKEVADKCDQMVPFTPNMQHAQNILQQTRRNAQPSLNGQYIYFTPAGAQQGYAGGFSLNGEGTLRVKYLLCTTGPMSLVGQSVGSTFLPYNLAQRQGSNDSNDIPSCCCCFISACYAELLKPIETILQVYQQNLPRDAIFDKAVEKSECFTLTIRILAFLGIVFGIYLFFSPIVNILNYIPLVGGLISGIVGFAILLAAFLIAIPLFLIFITISWLVWHPKIGAILLIISVAVTTLILVLGAKGNNDSYQQMGHLLRNFT